MRRSSLELKEHRFESKCAPVRLNGCRACRPIAHQAPDGNHDPRVEDHATGGDKKCDKHHGHCNTPERTLLTLEFS